MPLTNLPPNVVPPPDPTVHLAVRNTLRGKHVGLPSGQQVAKAMRVNALSNATLGISTDPGWGGEAPLWFYILREAEANRGRLAGVGARIVAETFHRAMEGSEISIVRDTGFVPTLGKVDGRFAMADLLVFAFEGKKALLNPLGG